MNMKERLKEIKLISEDIDQDQNSLLEMMVIKFNPSIVELIERTIDRLDKIDNLVDLIKDELEECKEIPKTEQVADFKLNIGEFLSKWDNDEVDTEYICKKSKLIKVFGTLDELYKAVSFNLIYEEAFEPISDRAKSLYEEFDGSYYFEDDVDRSIKNIDDWTYSV